MTTIINKANSSLRFIDSYGLNLSRKYKWLKDASTWECWFESLFDFTGALSAGASYVATTLNKLSSYKILPSTPFTFELSQTVGWIGFITSSLSLIKESISLKRQCNFLNIFKNFAYTPKELEENICKTRTVTADQKKNLHDNLKIERVAEKVRLDLFKSQGKEVVEELTRLAYKDAAVKWPLLCSETQNMLNDFFGFKGSQLERALPEWLWNDLRQKEGGVVTYLAGLSIRVDQGDEKAIKEAMELLQTVRTYARRQMILHIVGITVAVIGIIGSLASLFFPLPLIAAILLTALGFALVSAIYMIRRGYAENPDIKSGFSFELCLPAFLRSKPEVPAHLQRIDDLKDPMRYRYSPVDLDGYQPYISPQPSKIKRTYFPQQFRLAVI